MNKTTKTILVLAAWLVVLGIIGNMAKAFGQTPQRPTPFRFQLPQWENRAFVPTYPTEIRVVNQDLHPLPSAYNLSGDNAWTGIQVIRYDEYGHLIELMGYTSCYPIKGSDPVLCADWDGKTKIFLPAGRYLLFVQAYPYRVRWVEFEVFPGPSSYTFVQAQLMAAPLRQWITINAAVQGSDLKGSFDISKREPGEYDAKIELRAYGPGLGSFSWVGFTPRVWERKLTDANPTTTVEFEITIPPGLPKGYPIFVEVTGMLRTNGFVQDAWGYNTVTIR